jgi:hypothetical protein
MHCRLLSRGLMLETIGRIVSAKTLRLLTKKRRKPNGNPKSVGAS